MVMNNTEQIAQQFQDVFVKQYGEVYADAASFVMPNLPNGCSWGFAKSGDINEEVISNWRKDPNVQVFDITGGVLVNVDFMELVNRIQGTVPIFSEQDLQYASKFRDNSRQACMKYLTKLGNEGTSRQVTHVGVFNTNDTNTITVSGQTYKAFNVDIVDFVNMAANAGLGFVVEGQAIGYQQFLNNLERAVSSLVLAPSGNALFVDVIHA